MAFKTVNGRAPGPPKMAAKPAGYGGTAKNGNVLCGTDKGPDANKGAAPPKVKVSSSGGNFTHPKGSY